MLQVLLDEPGVFRHIRQLSQLHGNNQVALAPAHNPTYHGRMKHIDIQHHLIRELVTADKVFLKYYPTTINIADILTKALTQATH